jgi:hypothetical protein
VWGQAGVAGLYVAAVVWLFPQWFEVAKTGWIAYAAYDADVWVSRRTVLALAAIAGLATANEILGSANAPEKQLGRVVAAAALGALGSYVLQHKAIEYQFIPARTLIWVQGGVLVLVAAGWAQRLGGPAWFRLLYRGRAALLCLLLIVPLYRSAERTAIDGRQADRYMQALAALLRANGIGPRLVEFGTSAFPAYPLSLYRETLPAWRFPQLWMLPWIAQQDSRRGSAPEAAAIETRLRAMVREDFQRFRPDAILIDESPRKLALPADFRFLQWFRRDAAMAAILDRYERVAEFEAPDDHRYFFTRLGLYRRVQ